MIDVEVRVVREAEWSALRDVRLAALKDTPEAFWSSYDVEASWPDERWRAWASSGAVFVAWTDGRAVGLAAGTVHDRPGLEPDHHLVSMWVAPEARGRGIAPRLIEAVVGWARSAEARSLSLWVVDGNAAARRVYERAGFVLTGEHQDFPGGDPRTESRMLLELG